MSPYSNSLHWFLVRNTRGLEVIAPSLEELYLWTHETQEVDISAPKLAKVTWHDAYDPLQHRFTHVCRRLRLLRIGLKPTVTQLLKQFDEVDELRLEISIPQGIAGYESFMNEANKLLNCETLKIFLVLNQHGLVSAILHLLRCCSSIKKLSAKLISEISCGPSLRHSCPSACPCRLAESCKIDDIALSSLEDVEIDCFSASHEEMEFVEQLSRCNAVALKKLVINCTSYPAPLTKEVCQKIRGMCRSNLEIEFYVEWRRVCFD